jgi:hypothetical protein
LIDRKAKTRADLLDSVDQLRTCLLDEGTISRFAGYLLRRVAVGVAGAVGCRDILLVEKEIVEERGVDG